MASSTKTVKLTDDWLQVADGTNDVDVWPEAGDFYRVYIGDTDPVKGVDLGGRTSDESGVYAPNKMWISGNCYVTVFKTTP